MVIVVCSYWFMVLNLLIYIHALTNTLSTYTHTHTTKTHTHYYTQLHFTPLYDTNGYFVAV